MNTGTTRPPGNILDIRELTVDIDSEVRQKTILKGLNLSIPRGQTVALVGESGSGKTLAASSILGILPQAAHVTGGSIHFRDQNLLELKDGALQSIRGNKIGMVHQEPSRSLNPLMPIGKQIGETLKIHKRLGRRDTREQVLSLMELVGIPDPVRRYSNYPHQLSGGVRQRVVIASALACRPELLLADEPTSALDTTVQAQIIDLLSRLIQDLQMSVLLISHEMGMVAALADQVAVLLHGKVVEQGSVKKVLTKPAHPYTLSFLNPEEKKSRVITVGNIVEDDVIGCPYVTECRFAQERCSLHEPEMSELTAGHMVSCFLHTSTEPGE